MAHVLEVPIKEFLKEERKALTRVTSPIDPSFVRKVNAYQLEDGSIIWGATAMMLSELEVLLAEHQ